MKIQNIYFLILILVFGLSIHLSKAQIPVYEINSSKFGIIGGTQLSSFHSQTYGDPHFKGGIHIGVAYNIPIMHRLSIEPQIMYIKKGARLDHNDSPYLYDDYGSLRYKLHYIETPLQLNIRTKSIVDFFIGGYASYLLDANFDLSTNYTLAYGDLNYDDFEKYDFGFNGGVAFNFVFTKLSLRYSHGVRDIAKSNSANILLTEAKNQAFSISLTTYF